MAEENCIGENNLISATTTTNIKPELIESNSGSSEENNNDVVELNDDKLDLTESKLNAQLPNLLAPTPTLGSVISFSSMRYPHER